VLFSGLFAIDYKNNDNTLISRCGNSDGYQFLKKLNMTKIIFTLAIFAISYSPAHATLIACTHFDCKVSVEQPNVQVKAVPQAPKIQNKYKMIVDTMTMYGYSRSDAVSFASILALAGII
jgi:hypothetical protein